MEFRILGPVESYGSGGPVPLAGARQLALVVALILRANRVVPVEQLIEAVWGEDPPAGVTAAVHTYISRLRKAFEAVEPGGGRRIVTHPAGYRLRVELGEVDLEIFRGHVQRAREAARAGLVKEAVTELRAGLALWRGPALAGVPGQFARAQAASLEGEHLAALEQRIELDLALGQGGELVTELSALTAAHPLRERPYGQLMLALYRAGRRAEALRVYQSARTVLVEELGIEPGPELQQLHQRILAADPELVTASPVGAGVPAEPGVVPRQLPGAIPNFVGRARELGILTARLDTASEGTVVISSIGGTAGIGKTTLAVYWGRQHMDRFPDGQLYVDLRGFAPGGTPMTPAEAVRSFLDAFQVPVERIPTHLDAQAALYRSLVEGKQMLIVLDNARDAEQVRPLLPGSPTCLVVVTSRQQLTSLIAREQAQHITLDFLTTEEARELLAKFLGSERIHAESDAVDELIERCVRLPIALTIAAARAVTNPHLPLGVLVNELTELSTGDSEETDIRAMFSWSYTTLTPDAAGLFRLLGLHPAPDLDLHAAASLTGIPTPQARALLAELTRAHLLEEHTPGRYRFHDLLRAYAGDQATADEPEPQRQAALHRVLDYYLHTGFAAERHLNPHRNPITLQAPRPGVTLRPITGYPQAMDWFTAEHPTLLAITTHAAHTGFDTHAWQLPWTLGPFLDQHGHWHDYAATQQIALAAAGRLGDHAAQARTHRYLGWAYARLGRHAEARSHLQQALTLDRELGDRTGQATTHHALSAVCEQQGHYAQALTHIQHALDLHRATGHHIGEAQALNALGWDHALLGHYQQALTHCQQALDLLRELGDRVSEAATLDSLGYAHHHLGHHDQATTHYQQAIALYRELGDHYNEAATLIHLGDTHHAAGDHPDAREAWQQALAILDELGHPDAEHVRAKLADLDQTGRG